MNLHQDKSLFSEIIERASEHPVNGGLGIPRRLIEKDYILTNALCQLSEGQYRDIVIFKGGNSLSKGYDIGNLLSGNIDVALMKDGDTGKHILGEHDDNNCVMGQITLNFVHSDILLPFQKRTVKSFVYDYLISYGYRDIVKEFELEPFEVNILDKKVTMTQELVELVRVSLADNPIETLEKHIRNFYDLHYLYEDEECREYLTSYEFKRNFDVLYNRDRATLEEPHGWNKKNLTESPLSVDFNKIWEKLIPSYYKELPPLSYALTVPLPDKIQSSFIQILHHLPL